ncbi:CDP-glucose 4,6-dehydratase [Methanoregula sp.]|uniref:CDP-glucose 4,6-dehydratase n=1 Tax=Methanoregula sp. TaxID=2052170 RepID=UPI0025ECC180|nr:CDP-glucose 4,6-dehydratase [Methanoregula sp.]
MNSRYAIFKNKKVLVTGDTGFKGSWLTYWLHLLGADVYGFALPPERDYDHFVMIGLEKRIHHYEGEIGEYSQIQDLMKRVQPEFVFHLAAQPLIRRSYREPKLTLDTNIGGTVNVLESVRLTPSVKVLVSITSDKCYRNKEWCWGYRENDELGGKDPYSASKAAAEIVYSAYHDSFFSGRPQFGAASVRAGNVIGGGDWSVDRIVPDCIRALQAGKPIELRNPHATRPWQHVLEPLSGYLLLASRMYNEPVQFRGSYNFGPDTREMHTVQDVARELISTWGTGEIKITRSDNDPPEAGLLHLNCDKAHHILGWYPRWDFRKTVEQTAYWYKAVKDGEDAHSVTRQQIIEYMEN